MSRPLRILYEGAYYHVMNRGAGRRKIFNGLVDREVFLQTLSEACEQFGFEVHAYCLMGNHYHLLLRTPLANLSRAMRHINGVYTQRYNRLNKTDGALFRGRYKAIVVDSDAYLLHLSKYIHLNPISARMVESLEQYEWSSYLAYIGKIKAPTWLVCDEVYSQLTTNHSKPEHYQHFMTNENLDKSLIKFYQQQTAGPILGNEAFINKLALIKASSEVPRHIQVMKRPTILAIISEISSMHGEDISSIVVAKRGRGKSNELRKMAMYIARKHGNYRLHEIAEAFGLRHYGGASSTIHLFMQELEKDQLLREKVAAVVKMMGIKII